MIDLKHTIGWLCVMRYQGEHGVKYKIPQVVLSALLEHGLMENCETPGSVQFSEKGIAATDLYGPDWGIGSSFEDEEAQTP